MALVSTKGRYAVRAMLDLAEHNNGSYIALKDIASRQEISNKYLENILPSLTKAGLISGLRGKGGGYKLVKSPEEYPIYEILKQVGEDLCVVNCLSCPTNQCHRSSFCKTLPMWSELNVKINSYLKSTNLADLLNKPDNSGDYFVI
jgi:Rrf2 family protein